LFLRLTVVDTVLICLIKVGGELILRKLLWLCNQYYFKQKNVVVKYFTNTILKVFQILE